MLFDKPIRCNMQGQLQSADSHFTRPAGLGKTTISTSAIPTPEQVLA
jgi:hypothetical protein